MYVFSVGKKTCRALYVHVVIWGQKRYKEKGLYNCLLVLVVRDYDIDDYIIQMWKRAPSLS